ncbi:hypothetical protein ACJ41O_006210 [Fusarium nematophilum]
MAIYLPNFVTTLAAALTSRVEAFSSSFYRKHGSESLNFGISILHSPPSPEVDIVLVHGVGAEATSAWTYTDDSTRHEFCWPTAELPPRLRVQARILAYDYDSKFRTAEYLASRTLLHQTGALVEALERHRQKARQRPIVFVCHSLGGIVVKNALVNARSSNVQGFKDVYHAVTGIVFLGTPHTSSPGALADSLCHILGLGPDDERYGELRDRSTTLAYSLDRFKPLAASLHIYAITETPSLSRHDTDLDKQPRCERHKHLSLRRDHVDLCKFSSREDEDLHIVIGCIDKLCPQAAENSARDTMPREDTGLHGRMIAEDKVHGLGMGQALTAQVSKRSSLLDESDPRRLKKLETLEKYFVKWLGADLSTPELSARPVAILQGPPGCGKTETALRYVGRNHQEYSSILWVNAANQKSLAFSFQDIATRMISQYEAPDTAAKLLGLEGISLDEDRDLDGEDLRILEQAVMDWLTRPHEKKWLLILDGLSQGSGYPVPAVWTQFDQTKHSGWWREFLRRLPSTAGDRGHVIISTRENDATALGQHVILFAATEAEKEAVSPTSFFQPLTQTHGESLHRIDEWWHTAQVWERRVLELALFLSDENCRKIPLFLLETVLPMDKTSWKSTIPELERDESCVRLSASLLNKGPLLLPRLTTDTKSELPVGRPRVLTRAAARAWENLEKGIQAIRKHRDLIFAWEDEAQVAQNISAVSRRCEGVLNPEDLSQLSLCQQDRRNWQELASVCEAHAEYTTAKKLYDLERTRHHRGGKTDFQLRLDCARVYQLSGDYDSAEIEYEEIFSSTYKDLFPSGFLQKPVDDRITAYRQLALMRASQGRFNKAVEEISHIVALEDPFGDDSDRKQVSESMSELALYLAKGGSGQAAGAVLQRIIVSLEQTRGTTHPATLGAMEVLSTIKMKQGELEEALHLVETVYDGQRRRLGDRHPTTVLCRSKIATACDLGGDAKRAEAIYVECLEVAAESLGPRHPDLFGMRQGFVRCLLNLRKRSQARHHLQILKHEVESSPKLYPRTTARRINHLLDGKWDDDYFEIDSLCSPRSTLGVGAFYDGGAVNDDEESVYDSDDSWGGYG